MMRAWARIRFPLNANGAARPEAVPRALIAGAGIGGLTAALALAKTGWDVVSFERATVLEEFGAGLQLTPNCTRILERLGVLDAIRELAMTPTAIRIRRGRDDTELSRLDLTRAEQRWGAPYLVIHRADLQRALLDAAKQEPRFELRLGQELAGLAENDTSVLAGVKRGLLSLQETGDILIGADGLRSKARDRIGDAARDIPKFSGRVAFRATIPASGREPSEVVLRLGPHAHLVQYPLRGGSVINLVAVVEAGWRVGTSAHPWDGEADRPALERAFEGWSSRVRALIEAPESWRAWPLYVREPLPSFAAGRVALLGDAAHPMVPFLAQGAAQAIEDAGSLATQLAEIADAPAALAAYSRDRAPRAGRVQREALAQARVYHMSGPMAFARDLTMRALGSERLLARYDWLYAA